MKKKSLLLIMGLIILSILSACKQEAKQSTEKPAETPVVEEKPAEKKDEKKAENVIGKDEITGLNIISKDEMQFAKSLEIIRLEDDYILVNMTEGKEYLVLVPKDKALLTLEPNVRQAYYPSDNLGVYGTNYVGMLKAIGHLDNITSTNNDEWFIDGVKERIDSGKIAYVGKNSDLDFELVQASNPDVILSSGILKDEVLQKLNEMEIPWTNIYLQDETDPRGRIEWIKLFGIIVGDEEAANKYFDNQISRIEKITSSEDKAQSPTFVNVRVTGDTVSIKRKDDYSVKMLELGGGTYGISNDVEDGTGIMKVGQEEFYKMAENVDIILHENMGPYVGTIADFISYGEQYADFKAVKSGNIWTTNKNYWQGMDDAATMIEELNMIMTGIAPDTMTYFSRMGK